MMVAAAAATATFPFSIFHCKLPKATNAARSLWFLCSFCGPSVLPCAFCYLLFGSSHSSLLATVYGGVFAVPSIKPGRLCFCFCPCIGPAAVFSFLFFFLPGLHTPAFAAYASDIAPLQWQCHSLVAGHWPHLVSGRILKRSGSWQNIEHLSPQDGNSKKGFKIGWTLVPK